MADEEKKVEHTENVEAAKTDAAAPEANSTVSHSEPAAVHSGADTPPLANDQAHAPGHADDAHSHDAHDDHAHSASGADFGEVIPEKNWQDSFLAGVAALVLCGFLFVGYTWSQVQPAPEHEESHEAGKQSEILVKPEANAPLKKPVMSPESETENPAKPGSAAKH